MAPYTYMMYDACKDGEFSAMLKKFNKQKLLMWKSNRSEFHRVKSVPSKNKSLGLINSISPESLLATQNKSVVYSFPKSDRKCALLISNGANEKRFLYNPRVVEPDPYYITHRK